MNSDRHAFETIGYEIRDHIAQITLNRPDSMNALSAKLKDELADALTAAEADHDVRVLVITGAGPKAFCAGADIKERAGGDPTASEFIAAQRRSHALFNRIAAFDRPVIAAINGVALGGGLEIALCADFRIAADHARVGLTEVNLGVIPAGGGTQRLARLLGAAAAKRMILSASVLNAAEAQTIGLVDRVVPAAELAASAHALASSLAAKAPLALRYAKRAIDQGAGLDMAAALEIELYAASVLYTSEDRKEGMKAFVEKRQPVFRGR